MAVTANQLDITPEGNWWTYDFTWLPTKVLRVEKFESGHRGRGFQRALSQPFIKRATSAFDAAMIEPLIVVEVMPADGSGWYSVVDGQHKFHIMQRKELMSAPCLVHKERLSYQERAGLYTRLNYDRRRLSTEQMFAGRYEQEEDTTLALIELVERHGFYIKGFLMSPADVGLKRLSCLPTLHTEWRRDAAALSTAIRCLEVWAQHDLTYEGPIIAALCALARQEVFQEKRMKEKLDAKPPAFINNRAMKLDSVKTRPSNYGFRAAFAEIFNARLAKERQLEP